MKRIIFGVALSAVMSSQAYAQILVTDVGQNSQTAAQILADAAEFAENVVRWEQQVKDMEMQYEQMKKDYKAITDSRNLGEILNNDKYKDYLPPEWKEEYEKTRASGVDGLSGTAKEIYDENKIYDVCDKILLTEERIACEAIVAKNAQDKAFALEAYETAKDRINQIEQLMAAINDTQDPKAIAELQGRIAAEQANIQNEQTKLQMYSMVSASEDRIQEQRQRELNAKALDKREYKARTPVNFLAN